MEKSSFFNALLDSEGNPDRAYMAEDFAKYFSAFIGNGVFPNPSNNLQILSLGESMNITLSIGVAWINGYLYQNTDKLIFPITVADGVLNRIDRIVLRLDFLEREIKCYVKQGTFASNPVAPDILRNADIYELGLADIYIGHGAISINQGNITDLRQNKNVCGIVHGTIEQIDVTTLFNQYTEGFKIKQNEFETEFMEWFKNIQSELDGDIAANLLNKILKNESDISNAVNDIQKVEGNLKNSLIIVKDISILSSGWTFNSTSNFYEYKIANENININSSVDVNIHLDYLQKANKLKSVTNSINGYVVIYSNEKLTETIKCDIRILNEVI
ncbi:hypothetical protein [Clostridium senegalense]|uniref:hypothetical protein n=1 Tax=Clostridium senegalense TaxID=1465809 RepID=UPI000289B924|nr:hypothetical protein [Clostridium senegalense]